MTHQQPTPGHGLGQPNPLLLHHRESTPLLLSAWLLRECGLGLSPTHMKMLPSTTVALVECDVRRGCRGYQPAQPALSLPPGRLQRLVGHVGGRKSSPTTGRSRHCVRHEYHGTKTMCRDCSSPLSLAPPGHRSIESSVYDRVLFDSNPWSRPLHWRLLANGARESFDSSSLSVATWLPLSVWAFDLVQMQALECGW
jgi:hypothetical protein